jgi:hypothetical protein
MKLAIIAACLLATLTISAAYAQENKPDKKPAAENWRSLFDGKSLDGWKQTDFTGGGKVHLEQHFRGDSAAILVDAGSSLSGFNWTGAAVPKINYEISLEAMKLKGQDFMCGLTFPVGDSSASLILGGWGGYTTGISSIDRLDASENETQKSIEYRKDHWYHVRMRVMPTRLQAWLDDKKIIDVDTTGKKISLRFGDIDKSLPLGIATYVTDSAFRDIKLRELTAKEVADSSAKPAKP